jgi:hypothetical protein
MRRGGHAPDEVRRKLDVGAINAVGVNTRQMQRSMQKITHLMNDITCVVKAVHV